MYEKGKAAPEILRSCCCDFSADTGYWKEGAATLALGNGESEGEGSDMLKYIFAALVVPKS